MSSHHKGKGRQKRPRSPEAGQSSRRRPAPGTSQHPQVAQVTQGFENLALTTTSHDQSQYYNLPQPPMPAIAPQYPQVGQVTQSMENLGIMTTSYGPIQYSHLPPPQLSTFGRATQIAAGQLSAEDEEKLRTAVATGASYPDIKDIMFSDRFDLTAQILQQHARRIDAEWLPEEDVALLIAREEEESRNLDDGYLARLQARLQEQGAISPSRTTGNIKARITNQNTLADMMNSGYPPTQRSSQGQQGPAYGTQGDIPASAAANPSYQAPGSSSYQAGTFGQRRAGPSASSAQDYDVPPTAAQPLPGGTRQIYNYKAKTTPQFSQAEIKDIKIKLAQGGPAYRENPAAYPNADPPSYKPVAATQGLAYSNAASAPTYGSAQARNQPFLPNEAGDPEQGSSSAGHEQGAEVVTCSGQMEKYVPDVKLKLAQDWTWVMVQEAYCPQYGYSAMLKYLHKEGCRAWTQPQSKRSLLWLHGEGYSWAQICDRLPGPRRTAAEVEARYRRLCEGP